MKGNDHISEHRTYGKAVQARLGALTVPAALQPVAQAFTQQHDAYEAACVQVQATEGRRDAALTAIRVADGTLDGSVEGLATAVVGAGLGKRTSPFAAFSQHTPSKLEGLAYAVEAKEVVTLCQALTQANPPDAVKAAVAICLANAAAVEAALDGLTAPQQAYAQALAARDALLPEWTRSLGRLEKHAAVAFDGQPGVVEALFAKVAAVQQR